MRDLRRNDGMQLRKGDRMSARDDADWDAELRLWEQANQRRDLVLRELTQRLLRQTERDNRLVGKLAAMRARLDGATAPQLSSSRAI
jgi:hypothetical protein